MWNVSSLLLMVAGVQQCQGAVYMTLCVRVYVCVCMCEFITDMFMKLIISLTYKIPHCCIKCNTHMHTTQTLHKIPIRKYFQTSSTTQLVISLCVVKISV